MSIAGVYVKVILNQVESVALAELLRRACADADIELNVFVRDDGKREIEILVGELASRLILQRKVIK